MCKSVMKISKIVLLLFVTVLAGCKQEFEDISNSPEFNHLIGASYKASTDMVIVGINSPPGYAKEVDFYAITKLYNVQHKAPEDVTRDIFKKGSSFKIISIHECANCLWFVKPKQAVVTTTDFEKKADVPITVPLHELISGKSLEQVQ